jgi:hypothetical protein
VKSTVVFQPLGGVLARLPDRNMSFVDAVPLILGRSLLVQGRDVILWTMTLLTAYRDCAFRNFLTEGSGNCSLLAVMVALHLNERASLHV